jgi:hypothetical protein
MGSPEKPSQQSSTDGAKLLGGDDIGLDEAIEFFQGVGFNVITIDENTDFEELAKAWNSLIPQKDGTSNP